MINVDISPITGLSPIFFYEQKRTLILFSILIQGDDCHYLSWNHLNVSDDIDLSCNTTKTFPEMISIDSTWQTSILFSVHHNQPGSDNFPLSRKEFYIDGNQYLQPTLVELQRSCDTEVYIYHNNPICCVLREACQLQIWIFDGW